MLDVAKRLLECQRAERVAHSDALSKRRVCRAIETPVELRLSDQQHGQEILIVELEIREQPDLIECRLARKQLRLIDDQHRLAATLVQLNQLCVNLVEQIAAQLRRRDAQSIGDRAQQLVWRQARIDE